MDLKPDIAFRASDGTDSDRVRADIELLNQRLAVLSSNIQLLASAVESYDSQPPTIVTEKITIAPGGGLSETESGVKLDILGLPIGSSTVSGWLVVEGDDGNLYRVPAEDFVAKPAIENPNDVPTLQDQALIVSAAWSGSSALVTRNELYAIAQANTTELDKIRSVLQPTLTLLRNIGSNGNNP